MDQNRLQKEIEDLRRKLQEKELELSRISDGLCVDQPDDDVIYVDIDQTNNIPGHHDTNEGSYQDVTHTPSQANGLPDEDEFQSVSFDSALYTNVPEKNQYDSSTGIRATNKCFLTNSHNREPQTPSGLTKTQSVARKTETEPRKEPTASSGVTKTQKTGTGAKISDKLPRWAIERYSRQILLPDIGISGQEKLCAARVLIVGAGGLGCPAGVYLAGAGVGEIGIVDYDTVELTNIHRQFLHGERDQHTSKAHSAADSLRSINSRIKVTAHKVQLNSSNAVQIASQYDLVVDCTDNVPTRYLLNDLCVLNKLPLISGSALKMDGQLTVYGYRADKNPNEKDPSYIGPCYRCVFPRPPPAEAVGSCSTSGVAGPVPGAIGSLQALEAMKYIVGHSHTQLLVERMLLFDGDDTTFRTVRLRARNPECAVCSNTATITQLVDYEQFCRAQAKEQDLELRILPPEHRISPSELSRRLTDDCGQRHLLVDVRSEAEFNMCAIDGSTNYPIEKLRGDSLERLLGEIRNRENAVTFICRRGNDSQLAAKKVLEAIEKEHHCKVTDLSGGLHAWSSAVDTDFPVY